MERFNMDTDYNHGCTVCYGDAPCKHNKPPGVTFVEPKEPTKPVIPVGSPMYYATDRRVKKMAPDGFKPCVPNVEDMPTVSQVINEWENETKKIAPKRDAFGRFVAKEQSEIDKCEVDGEAEKPRAYSSMRHYYDQGYLQPNHMTREERYPIIFDRAKELQPRAKRILSFGCSTGEEAQALAKRFPGIEIVGVDLDHTSVQTARSRNKGNPLMAFQTDIGGLGKFDLVTCLNVFFCMEEPVPKETLHRCLRDIDTHLNPGGVLMVYTSDHDPKEVLGNKYKDLNVWQREHNKNKKMYFNGYYRKRRWYHF